MSRNIKTDFWDKLTEDEKHKLIMSLVFGTVLAIWLILLLCGAPIS